MRRETLCLLGIDLLCAALLSLGAVLTILPAFGLQAPLGLVLPAVLLLLALAVLEEKKPWLPPSLLCAAALLTALFAAVLGRWQALVTWLGEAAQKALEGSSVSGDAPHLAVYLVAAAPVVLIFWLVMRKLPSLCAVTVLSAGLLGYLACSGREDWLLPFLLLCAGNILFLPRKPLKGSGRLRTQVLAAMLLVPILGLSLWFGPKADGEWQSKTVRYTVQDIQDFWEFHWGELPRLPITSMRSMGLQPEASRLGGDLELGDSTLITAGQELLLRGQALDFYTGSSWEDHKEERLGNFRWDSVWWQSRRQEAFGQSQLVPISIPLLKDLLVEVETDIYRYWPSRTLFLPYRTSRITTEESGGSLYFDSQGEAYWAQSQEGTRVYQVEASAWNYRDIGFDRNMLFLEKAVLEEVGPDPYYETAAEYALQLPETLPPWVGELAAELTADLRTPYAKAIALRDYLSDTCEYTLTPGDPDPEQDFVAEFLISRRGYCTYYASALTILCRLADIPARYVTGYSMVKDGGRYKATQSTAHAWTEIYLANIGWVPLDALNQNTFAQNAELLEEEKEQREGKTPAPTPTPGASQEGETLLPETAAEQEAPFHPYLLLWLLPLPGGILGVLLAKFLRSRRYRETVVRRKYPKPRDAAEHYYRGLMRLLRFLKLVPQEGETLGRFWERCEQKLSGETATEWKEIGRIMSRLRFGGISPGPQELSLLQNSYRELEQAARKALGFWGRLWL